MTVKKAKLTQKQVLIKHLKLATITSFESYKKYGITQLAARISELKDKGYNIISIPTNAKGVVKYKLVA